MLSRAVHTVTNMKDTSVNEPNHVVVDLHRGKPVTVLGVKHSTLNKHEVRVAGPDGKTVCTVAGNGPDAIAKAMLIAKALDYEMIARKG